MSGSSESQTRARVVSEMARTLDRPSSFPQTSTSSSTSTGFDPDNEACTSTRRLDRGLSQILPELCDSAKKYRPGQPRPLQADARVATSVLADAFPDFSEDFDVLVDESMSIELGRGTRKAPSFGGGWHKRDNSTNSTGSVKARAQAFDIQLSPAEDAKPVPKKPTHVPRRGSLEKQRALFERENVPSVAKPQGKVDVMPRKNSVEEQRAFFERENLAPLPATKSNGSARAKPSLAKSHARVVDSEPSLTVERPALAPAKTRSTRFAKSAPVAATQSIVLPDVSNLSELVSVLGQDTTRQSKPSSRFVSAKAARAGDDLDHAGVQSAPVLGDERAIVAAIKDLEDRLVESERKNAKLEAEIGRLGQQRRADAEHHAAILQRISAERHAERASIAAAPVHSAVQRVRRQHDRGGRKAEEDELPSPDDDEIETKLSAIDPDELERLRKMMEEERLAMKAKRQAKTQDQHDVVRPAYSSDDSESLSSVEMGPTVPAQAPATAAVPAPAPTTAPAPAPPAERKYKRPGATTGVSRFSKRPGPTAFQPITARATPASSAIKPGWFPAQLASETKEVPAPSMPGWLPARLAPPKPAQAPVSVFQEVLAGITGHQVETTKDCGDCGRVATYAEDRGADLPNTTPDPIPDPIPVSQRAPSPNSFQEDPTVRPSQPPFKALKAVLKGLEDEKTAAARELEALQALHNSLDASKGRRKRKRRLAEIQRLLALVDSKADQIYALHDVLEAEGLAA
ncbi:MAG: hypothetical protein M1832_004184 [Thelocarpon impressellum]|nr:MAG: hypothetical protein M1832_004184 [Thelocarpon impressellum]